MLNYQAEWEEVRVSHSVISDSLRSHGLWPTRLLCPWNSPGNSSGVDSHFMPSFCSVTQSCPTLLAPMDCGTPGSPVLHCLLELAQTHVHRVSDAIQTSHPAIPFSSCPQSFPVPWSFPMSWFSASGGQGNSNNGVQLIPLTSQWEDRYKKHWSKSNERYMLCELLYPIYHSCKAIIMLIELPSSCKEGDRKPWESSIQHCQDQNCMRLISVHV